MSFQLCVTISRGPCYRYFCGRHHHDNDDSFLSASRCVYESAFAYLSLHLLSSFLFCFDVFFFLFLFLSFSGFILPLLHYSKGSSNNRTVKFFTIAQLKFSFFFGVTVIRATASPLWSWFGKGRDY
ncbi:hypothetical protein LI328DRAFT_136621 [Trichoderma asperelloides]|nr:hypothetical protein LI328DRAFT_136621 [Trichoderma asperelloides]